MMAARRRRRLDPAPLLRRRRRNRRIFTLLVLAVLGWIVWDRSGLIETGADDHRRFDQQSAVVIHVVDGDTVHIQSPDGRSTEKVRLIGIDAPERSAHWYEQATQALRSLCENRAVTLKLEPLETRDRYGRLLAYLYTNDSSNVNLEMVRQGHAYAHRRFKHTYRSQFEQAENEARTRQRGLWKDVQPEQMPAWRQQWLAEQP